MFTLPPLSIYVLSGIVGALLATGVQNNPLRLVSAETAVSRVAATTDVDRSRKGDRLPIAAAVPVTNTTIVPKNIGAPKYSSGGLSGVPPQPVTRIVQPKGWAMNISEDAGS